jgi:hypothetical protein
MFRMKTFDALTREASDVLGIEEKRQGGNGGGGAYLTDNIIAIRLLLAEIKATTRKGEDAIKDFSVLSNEIASAMNSGDAAQQQFREVWQWRVRWALINTTVRGGYVNSGVKQLLQTHQDLSTLGEKQLASPSADVLSMLRIEEAKVVVLCRISRALLQVGALKAAIGYCDIAAERVGKLTSEYGEGSEESVSIIANLSMHTTFARALALFGINDFGEAMALFETIIQDSGNSLTAPSVANPHHTAVDGLWTLPSMFEGLVHVEESLLAAAVNNYAVCALHQKKVHDSIIQLEKLIARDPARFMIDPVVFNLCTLYDLSCSPELSVGKKKMMQRVAAHYNVHEPLLNTKSYRLS